MKHFTDSDIPEVLFRIGDLADQENLPCYLVGGYVRDILMHRPCTDIDIMVVGDPVAFAKNVRNGLNGKNFVVFERFRTAQFEMSAEDSGSLKIEIVGARKESYNPDSRKPITQTGTLEDDLSRRDFTINALAMSLNARTRGALVDQYDGLGDLDKGILRTPLEPEQTFSDDPLRMMRAARFAAQFGFSPEPLLVAAITAMHERIRIVSRERISQEFFKIMLSPKPSVGLKLLYETGILGDLLPEVTAMAGIEQVDGLGHKDTLFHTFQVVDNVAKHSDKLWLRISALLHDIAKPVTKRFNPAAGWTFHGHEAVGIRIVARIFKSMRWPSEPLEYVQKMVRMHHRPIPLSKEEITDSAIRRLMFDAGPDLEDLMSLCRADVTSKNPRKVMRIMKNFGNVEQKIAEVAEKDLLAQWRPPIGGADIMETLGLSEGKMVGLIKSRMENAVIDGIIPYDREAALAYVRELYAELRNDRQS
ncbi:MAG: CCA tRNA nucleotidyltransferase [Chlorobium sp.]|uniref:CCA tRNA nucleotidyltransferase n=1 Tax=Chlorobium sp. TaxID=1095 RepID=UPI0025B8742B|nr:CCA tRNA nucleotidyltransferase [Chlorobium sp.]MCF8216024.1 CCA tRNA nucleotidyltransferase [Chlorobium sp.]MCF8270925.1 CCA tRNA nucleotidyltransferase [Chlorobium sp.]MCF8287299.1 CCA tRNA nucleotidyltransferase [Chlorobium sp.]MCF8291674.1 CCA tRNA nucleotidyltransferase [Chlorobium sp.]MCF8384933.1 CCA tRNA nucleotidyltransferase [Chlorobium sp.]